MEFDNQELKTKFEVSDKPTARQVLKYDSLVELSGFGENAYERLWTGVKIFAEKWESEFVQPEDDLDSVSGNEAIDVIKWAGLSIFSFRQSLRDIPKN